MSGRIVVGVDGSPHSAAALRWAVEEAQLRGASIVALHAWTYVPPAPLAEPGMVPMPATDIAADLGVERDAAERVLRDAGSVVGDVEVERRLVEATPGDALVEASRDADLVVVGTRGRGGIASALMGSVSSHVTHHAHCPVVVVRHSGD